MTSFFCASSRGLILSCNRLVTGGPGDARRSDRDDWSCRSWSWPLGLFYAIYQQDQDDAGDTRSQHRRADRGTDGSTRPAHSRRRGRRLTARPDHAEQQAAAQRGRAGRSRRREATAAPRAAQLRRGAGQSQRRRRHRRPRRAGRRSHDPRPGQADRFGHRGRPGRVGFPARQAPLIPASILHSGEQGRRKPATAETEKESETSVVVLVPEVAKDIAGRSSLPAGRRACDRGAEVGDGPTRVLNVPGQTGKRRCRRASRTCHRRDRL